MKKLLQLIKDRKIWLAKESIDGWNDDDTIHIAELYARQKVNELKQPNNQKIKKIKTTPI